MKQAGGRDWAAEVEKRDEHIQRLKPENDRLRRTMKEIQNVNNTNKVNTRTFIWLHKLYLMKIDFWKWPTFNLQVIYLKEKETLTRELTQLRTEVQIIREREVIERGGGSAREQELEIEVRELAEMVNRISSQAGGTLNPYHFISYSIVSYRIVSYHINTHHLSFDHFKGYTLIQNQHHC